MAPWLAHSRPTGMFAAVEKRCQAIEGLIREVETLIEGIASTINKRIPRRRKRQVAVEAVRLLLERLQASGALGRPQD